MPPAETRQRLLDAAEELFARRGIGETSLRALTRAAGVNLAAVHYHFGSKEGLLDAVVERRATPINEARRSALARLASNGGDRPDAESILLAFFEPLIDHMEMLEREGRKATLARLLARIEARPPAELEQLARRHFGEIGCLYVDALVRALPHLPPEEVAERFRFANAVLNALFSGSLDLDTLPGCPPPEVAASERARHAVAFALAGLRAPARVGGAGLREVATA